MPQIRQLAAIMFTDIVGYTALMGEDEEKAFELLEQNRNLQKPIIEKYNGRWIKELGDGVMASFSTVSDAVYAAKEIQEQCRQTGKFLLRIGIHQGEIVFQNDDVFGDTVNICSRIQALAPVGGILVSEPVYKNISNNRTIKTQFWGEEVLKNVREPVRIYEIVDKTFVTEGELRSTNQRQRPKKSFLHKRLAIIGISVLLLAALGFGYWSYSSRNTTISSIAILPFENRSTDPDTEYLSDGLAESLIYRLSQLPNLKVSPTSSVFRYKGKETDVKKISNELEVNAVMSGRIVQRGDNLTISVELVDVRNNKLLWGEQYQRKMSELLATQREIAATIAEKLQLELVGDQAKGITHKYTNSNDANQLYLKARYHFAKRTKADMLQAVDYYRQAIAIDPSFALAYARIAEVYLNLPTYPYTSPNEALPQGRAAVQKALELDPMLSEAHTFNAFNLAGYEWKWAEAESEFKLAIELDPNSSAAHFRYGQIYLAPRGAFDESIAEMKKALDMEPFDIVIGGTYAWAYLAKGQNDKALEIAKKTYDLEPYHPIGRHFMAMTYNVNGMYDDAITVCENALKSDSTSQFMLQSAGIAYAQSGHRDKADQIIKRFEELGKTQYVAPYSQAAVQVALGNRNKAFALLEKAHQVHDWFLIRLKVDPYFASLRDDPRFKEMLRKIGLPQ